MAAMKVAPKVERMAASTADRKAGRKVGNLVAQKEYLLAECLAARKVAYLAATTVAQKAGRTVVTTADL
jgi:hypothetical protein